MNLAEVGLIRVTRDARAMLDLLAGMSVAFHPVTLNETNTSFVYLGERMSRAQADGDDDSRHAKLSLGNGGPGRPPTGAPHLLSGRSDAAGVQKRSTRASTVLLMICPLRLRIVSVSSARSRWM